MQTKSDLVPSGRSSL